MHKRKIGIMRAGKTKRDKESGAWHRNNQNIKERAEWQKIGGEFPRHTCNGKKNRLNRKVKSRKERISD